MGEFDTTLGALCVSFMFASGLFGVLSVQAFNYFQNFPGDRRMIKLLVVLLWVLDALQLAFIGDALYFWAITNYTNPASLEKSTWSFNMGVFSTNTIVIIVELFLARRVFIVSQNIWLAVVIIVLSLAYYGFEMGTLIRTFQLVQTALFFKFQWIASTGLACAAAADLLIAASLSYYLHRSRTGLNNTGSVINKLLLYAISTGLLTSVFALIDMICFLTMPDNFLHLAFNIVIGKLYSNTMLLSLNLRQSLRNSAAKSTDRSVPLSVFITRSTNNGTDSSVTPKFASNTTQASSANTTFPTFTQSSQVTYEGSDGDMYGGEFPGHERNSKEKYTNVV